MQKHFAILLSFSNSATLYNKIILCHPWCLHAKLTTGSLKKKKRSHLDKQHRHKYFSKFQIQNCKYSK